MNNSAVLAGYLHLLQEKFGLKIAIKDRVGFYSSLNPEFAVMLLGFLRHENPFCEYIKSSEYNCSTCIRMFGQIDNKCKSIRKTFFGVCHGGVGEFVAPIFTDSGEYLGFITAGSYKMPRFERRVFRLCRGTIDPEQAIAYYRQLPACDFDITKESPALETAAASLEIAAQYISGSFQENIRGKVHAPIEITPEDDYVLSRIIQFLAVRYRDSIKISDIADSLQCSESYISHVFRKNTGLTVRSYINRLRVIDAKKLLRTTNDSVSAISDSLGFSSADYFARVFAHFASCSPTAYRDGPSGSR